MVRPGCLFKFQGQLLSPLPATAFLTAWHQWRREGPGPGTGRGQAQAGRQFWQSAENTAIIGRPQKDSGQKILGESYRENQRRKLKE